MVDEINCQLSIIIIISFSFDLTLCAYHIMKRRGKKLFFYLYVSSYCYCVKMKNHPNGMQLVCMCVGGEKKRRKEHREENGKGGVVERKEGDRFVLFFFLPTSIHDNEREEKEKEREKERGCFFFFYILVSANAGVCAH